MTKKKAQSKPAPEHSFHVGRWYRHNKRAVHRGLIYAIVIVCAIGALWLAYFGIANREVTLSKEEYIVLARQAFNLGNFDQAVLNYHKAQNVDASDQVLQRESFMARQRSNLNKGGTFELALAASYQVLKDDPNTIVGRVSLAQLFEVQAQTDSMTFYARAALQRAAAADDQAALVAGNLILATHQRTLDNQDSAFFYGRLALTAAQATGDTFQVAFNKAGLGFSALQIDSLDLARSLFSDLLSYRGINGRDVNDIGSSGLADYFHRRGNYDSAMVYLQPLSADIERHEVDGTTAYAERIRGRILREQGQFDAALEVLARSLESWHTLRSGPDVIDCINDMAATYRLKRDFFNARKFYMAAGNLANELKLRRKDLYTADFNLLFLQNLKPDEYRRAGEEGTAFARQYLVP